MQKQAEPARVERDCDPLWLLVCDHPPASLWCPPNILFDPPGTFSPTASWSRYRTDLTRWPDNEWQHHLLDQAKQVLAWRESVPPHFRFWGE